MDGSVRSIVLCGFMGTGKTVVGRELAALLGRRFVDLDETIAADAGRTIGEIFTDEGEVGFRRREREAVARVATRSGLVVAVGGGAVLDAENREALTASGDLVLLTADTPVLAARLSEVGARPLLTGADDLPTRIEQLMAERRPAYGQIPTTLDTSHLDPVAAASAVVRLVAPLPVCGSIDVPGAGGHAALAARGLNATRVVSGLGAVAHLGHELRGCSVTGRVVLAMPPTVRGHYAERLTAALAAADLPVTILDLPDGDEHKTFDEAARLVDRLAELGCGRDTCVVVAGGGVAGDLAGFAAAIYMRGIALAMVPTTLLAMVDAHLGGKTAVNTARAKNLAGAFHPPVLVLSDPVLLATLPDRELANGYAEAIKTALIGDAGLLERLESSLVGAAPWRDPELLADCVASCMAVKGGVVGRDPWELGERRALNLGHTMGHALEAQRDLGLAHGEAVSLGLLVALRLAVRRGLTEPELLGRVRRLLTACGLPTALPACHVEALREHLRLDKKRCGDHLRFVLPRAPGRVDIVEDVTDDEALEALTEEQACASS